MARAQRNRWQFAAHFRRSAFGWRSQPAIARVQEAVAEIRKVKRKDPALAAEGAVEQVDSSSGQLVTPSTARSKNSSPSSPQHRLILLGLPSGWSAVRRRSGIHCHRSNARMVLGGEAWSPPRSRLQEASLQRTEKQQILRRRGNGGRGRFENSERSSHVRRRQFHLLA